MAVAVPNATVTAMYQQFRSLVARHSPPPVHGLGLSPVNRGWTLGPLPGDGPSLGMGNNVVVSLAHCGTFLHSCWRQSLLVDGATGEVAGPIANTLAPAVTNSQVNRPLYGKFIDW